MLFRQLGHYLTMGWLNRISYSGQALIGIGETIPKRPLLTSKLFNILQYLGISRIRPRLCRGGKSNRPKIIKTITNHREDKYRPIISRSEIPGISRGVNNDNLISVKLSNEHTDDKKKVTIGQLNARSVKNKCFEITNLLLEKDIDVLAITETWLASGSADDFTKEELTPAGYNMLDVPRKNRKGGGVAIISKTLFNARHIKTPSFKSFEVIESLLQTTREIVRLCVIYRPPTSSKLGQPISTFLDEMQDYIDSRTTMSGSLLLLGDFNFHFDDNSNADTLRLKDMFSGLNLDQHVNGSTHKHGHYLDLVLTRANELDILNMRPAFQIIQQ